ncbi:MAG: 2-oxoacid:acceptor oxidoreductase family protein [Candidatus Caldarchaeum sp.]
MRLKIRFHGRGGQGIKTAGRIVGTAAFLEGYAVQDSPMYGPERRGAHVISFVRISDDGVGGRGYIFDPDAVIVADTSLVSLTPSPLQGLKEGGVVVLNSQRNVLQVHGYAYVAYDVSSSASRLLGMRSAISSGLAALACKALGIARWSSVEEAVKEEMAELGLGDELVEANIKLAEECYMNPPTIKPSTENNSLQPAESRVVELSYVVPSLSTAMILNLGNTVYKKTGAWRSVTPVIDYGKCTRCMVCYVYCPDSCISLEEDLTPRIDYDNCKGCLVCFTECPIKAVKLVEGGGIV